MSIPRPRREEIAIQESIEIDIDVACELKHADDAEQLEWVEEGWTE